MYFKPFPSSFDEELLQVGRRYKYLNELRQKQWSEQHGAKPAPPLERVTTRQFDALYNEVLTRGLKVDSLSDDLTKAKLELAESREEILALFKLYPWLGAESVKSEGA